MTQRYMQLSPAALSTFKHAASMVNPKFYELQRLRKSTWDTPPCMNRKMTRRARAGKCGVLGASGSAGARGTASASASRRAR